MVKEIKVEKIQAIVANLKKKIAPLEETRDLELAQEFLVYNDYSNQLVSFLENSKNFKSKAAEARKLLDLTQDPLLKEVESAFAEQKKTIRKQLGKIS